MHGGYGIGTVDGNICPVAEPAQASACLLYTSLGDSAGGAYPASQQEPHQGFRTEVVGFLREQALAVGGPADAVEVLSLIHI